MKSSLLAILVLVLTAVAARADDAEDDAAKFLEKNKWCTLRRNEQLPGKPVYWVRLVHKSAGSNSPDGFDTSDELGMATVAKKLEAFKGLTTIDMSDTKVTDAGLKLVANSCAKLNYLNKLSLPNTVTGAGLKELASLKNLTELTFSLLITGAGLKELAPLPKLYKLELSYLDPAFIRNVTDPDSQLQLGLKELVHLKNLTELKLSGSRVKDAVLRDLVQLKDLESLELEVSNITGTGLKELASLNKLTKLALPANDLTDVGFEEHRVAEKSQLSSDI